MYDWDRDGRYFFNAFLFLLVLSCSSYFSIRDYTEIFSESFIDVVLFVSKNCPGVILQDLIVIIHLHV